MKTREMVKFAILGGLFWMNLWFGYIWNLRTFQHVSSIWILLMVVGTVYVYDRKECRQAIKNGKAASPEWMEVVYNVLTMSFLIACQEYFLTVLYGVHSFNCFWLYREKQKMELEEQYRNFGKGVQS